MEKGTIHKVKWGILGCGNVTEEKSGPAFSLVNNSELVAVMRRNADKAQDYAQRHQVTKWYNNADDLINDPEINAVYVATPPDSHAELTIKALKAGKPVYVEKPMAISINQCKEMLQASERYNVPLFVAYYRRSLPGFLRVKELLESGVIGDIRLVNLKLHKPISEDELKGNPGWRTKPDIAGAGHFFDLASHQLDFMDYLFGPVQKVTAFAENQANIYEAEDIVTASFLMPQNILVNGSWWFTAPMHLRTDQIEIFGDKGLIRFSCFDFIPVELILDDKTETYEFPRPKHVQQYLIQNVVDELLGKGKSPSTGISGARTNWVMNEVVKEYYSND